MHAHVEQQQQNLKNQEKRSRGRRGNKSPVGLARFKATPALKKEVANFNSPVERVRGTYRRQGGCVLLHGCYALAAGRKRGMEPPSPAAVTAAPATGRPPSPPKPRSGPPGCTTAAEGQRQLRRQEGVVKPAGGRERPEPAKTSGRARFLQQPKPGAAAGLGRGQWTPQDPRGGVSQLLGQMTFLRGRF